MCKHLLCQMLNGRGGNRVVSVSTHSGWRVDGLVKPQPKHNPYINRVKNLNPNPHTPNMCNPFMTRVTRLNKLVKRVNYLISLSVEECKCSNHNI